MKRLYLLSLLCLLLIAPWAGAATYYVYSGAAAGGDGSYAAPFDTLADVVVVLVDGDTVRLKQGSTFREALSKDVSNVTVEAYGDGTAAMPIVYGDRIVAGASWSKTGGQTNVYQVTVAQTVDDCYLAAFEDGTGLAYVADVATCDATQGSFTVSGVAGADGSTSTGDTTIYIHTTDSSSPIVNGNEYSVSDWERQYCINLGFNADETGNTVKYIAAGRQSGANGGIVAGKNSLIVGCTIFQGVKHEGIINSGEWRDCIAWHEKIDSRCNNVAMEIFIADGSGLTATWTRCLALGPGNTTTGYTAFGGHNSGAGTYYDTSAMADCAASGFSSVGGPSPAQGDVTVDRVYSVLCGNGVTSSSAAGTTYFRDCWLVANPTVAATGFMITSDGATTVSNCRFWLDGPAFARMIRLSTVAGALSVTHCVFYETGGSGVSNNGVRWDGAGTISSLTFTQNIVAVTTTAPSAKVSQVLTGTATTYSIDNNAYLEDGTPRLDWDLPVADAAVVGTSNWFTKARAFDPAQEVSSIQANPQFTNPAAGNWTVGNASVTALGAGLEAASLTVTYLTVPSSATILELDWDGLVPVAATTPSPANSAVDVAVDASLSWADGGGAATYDVYLDDVLVSNDQVGTSYDPPTNWVPYSSHTWRIDSNNAAGTTTGTAWSFRAETKGGASVLMNLLTLP